MVRRINDGNLTGIKQDKFRNSRFELEEDRSDFHHYGGVDRSSPNTLGGPYAENRGRRSADSTRSQWSGSPFEDGKIYNWDNRGVSADGYGENRSSGNRRHGGAQSQHDLGNFSGKGPRGYTRADKSIFNDVCELLSLSPDVDASDIEVFVKNGVVELKGYVSDRRTKKLAEYEIENVSGVKDVFNRLTFRRKTGEEVH